MFDEKNAGDIADIIKDFFQDIGKNLNRIGLNVSLEELQSRYDEALKKIIRDEEREKNCHYISGEFKISVLDEKNYQCSYVLYFEDSDETFHTLEAKTKPISLDGLTEDFRNELKRDNVIKFEI